MCGWYVCIGSTLNLEITYGRKVVEGFTFFSNPKNYSDNNLCFAIKRIQMQYNTYVGRTVHWAGKPNKQQFGAPKLLQLGQKSEKSAPHPSTQFKFNTAVTSLDHPSLLGKVS